MKKSFAKAGLAIIGAVMLFLITSCNGSDDAKVISRPRGISVKVKASKF